MRIAGLPGKVVENGLNGQQAPHYVRLHIVKTRQAHAAQFFLEVSKGMAPQGHIMDEVEGTLPIGGLTTLKLVMEFSFNVFNCIDDGIDLFQKADKQFTFFFHCHFIDSTTNLGKSRPESIGNR